MCDNIIFPNEWNHNIIHIKQITNFDSIITVMFYNKILYSSILNNKLKTIKIN